MDSLKSLRVQHQQTGQNASFTGKISTVVTGGYCQGYFQELET